MLSKCIRHLLEKNPSKILWSQKVALSVILKTIYTQDWPGSWRICPLFCFWMVEPKRRTKGRVVVTGKQFTITQSQLSQSFIVSSVFIFLDVMLAGTILFLSSVVDILRYWLRAQLSTSYYYSLRKFASIIDQSQPTLGLRYIWHFFGKMIVNVPNPFNKLF